MSKKKQNKTMFCNIPTLTTYEYIEMMKTIYFNKPFNHLQMWG